jgi:hypothetical protein
MSPCRIDLSMNGRAHYRLVLMLGLPFEDSQRREIILDLLERRQRRLAIVGNGCIVLRASRFCPGSAPA